LYKECIRSGQEHAADAAVVVLSEDVAGSWLEASVHVVLKLALSECHKEERWQLAGQEADIGGGCLGDGVLGIGGNIHLATEFELLRLSGVRSETALRDRSSPPAFSTSFSRRAWSSLAPRTGCASGYAWPPLL
jgi:hypothetical protein